MFNQLSEDSDDNKLTTLPVEILIKIFKNLTIKDIRSLSRVCNLFREIGNYFKQHERYTCIYDYSKQALIKDFNYISNKLLEGCVYARYDIITDNTQFSKYYRIINYTNRDRVNTKQVSQFITIEGEILNLDVDQKNLNLFLHGHYYKGSLYLLEDALCKFRRCGIKLSPRYNN